MQLLKLIVWTLLAALIAMICANNWTPVTVKPWPGVERTVMLPALILGAYLLGFMPVTAWHLGSRWWLRRKISRVDRELVDARANDPAAPASQGSIDAV